MSKAAGNQLGTHRAIRIRQHLLATLLRRTRRGQPPPTDEELIAAYHAWRSAVRHVTPDEARAQLAWLAGRGRVALLAGPDGGRPLVTIVPEARS